MQYSTLHKSHTLLPCTVMVLVLRHAGQGWQCCDRFNTGVIRFVQEPGVGSDNGLELLVSQLVERHDFRKLLGIPRLVLHEVRDADVLHLSQCFQAVHVFK